MTILQTTFRAMPTDPDRCNECHAPQVDHYNGNCAPECSECGCTGRAGNPMRQEEHAASCSLGVCA